MTGDEMRAEVEALALDSELEYGRAVDSKRITYCI